MRERKPSAKHPGFVLLARTALLLTAITGGVIAGIGTAAAVNNNPSGNPTSPNLSYEADCTTTAYSGLVEPFVTSLDANTTVDTAYPAGVKFGLSGTASVTIPGTALAFVESTTAASSSTGVAVVETIGSTNGNATGTATYTHSYPNATTAGGQVTGVTFVTGTTTLIGTFPSGLTGDDVAGAGITPGTSVVSDLGSSINISIPTTATSTGESVGYGAPGGMTFTDTSFATPTDAFSTAGPNGGTAGIGVVAVTSVTVNGATPVDFGGTAGTGTQDCLETGWTSAPSPGPVQTGATAPALPADSTTALITGGATPVFQPGAYVNLVEPPPVADTQSVSLGIGQTETFTLSTSPGNPAYPVASCALVPGTISNSRLSVTFTNSPRVCSATLTDSGSGPATVTFQFTATDSYPLTSAAGTVSVTLTGLLVLSCAAPAGTQTGVTTCPLLTLPAITLDGLQQKSTAPATTVYVSDNRASPTVGWSLSTYMVETPGNPNPTCATLTDFCDSSVGGSAANPNGQIAASDLSISAPVCADYTGNTNPAPSAGAGGAYPAAPGALTLCTAAAGQSGGTFTMNTNFTLTIPSSVYAGLYEGTVEYLVS